MRPGAPSSRLGTARGHQPGLSTCWPRHCGAPADEFQNTRLLHSLFNKDRTQGTGQGLGSPVVQRQLRRQHKVGARGAAGKGGGRGEILGGTLWLIEVLCLIHSRGDPKWVQSVPFWKRSPWIERGDAEQLDGDAEGPRCFASHLPFHLFPKSFFTSKGKVIHIIRNPRDALVSGCFFWSRTNFAKNPDSLEQFFEQFIQGNGECPPRTEAGVHRVPIQTSLGPNRRPCISPPMDAPSITPETRPAQVPALPPTSTAQPSRCPWGTSWLSSSLSSRH
uniref:uncharacterized protein LOC120888064 n=1 Tax=Ictidomys tridecemlineatus TaxID=43179 RepID=UPI001A9D3FE9|nr:uncharacterized protein LOC120888064 [Ictidomys tridecemlineatus]